MSGEDFCVSRASVSSVDFLEFCPLILTGMIAARSLDDRHTGHGASAALYTLSKHKQQQTKPQKQ